MDVGAYMLTIQQEHEISERTRFCTECGAEAGHHHPTRARGRRVPIALGLIAVVLLVVVGWTSQHRATNHIARLQATEATLREALKRQSEAATAATNGLSDRLGHVEAKLDAQPDPSAIAKAVGASVFTIDADMDLGSGFAISGDGSSTRLVTNYHVVEDTWKAGN